MTATRAVYGAFAAGLAALWIGLLAAPVLSTRLEMDLWWMMPLMKAETQRRSGLGLLVFLLSPAPFLLGQPLLKCYLGLHTSMVGFSIPKLLGLSMVLHALNAWGVYGLSRGLGFSKRVGGIAGVVYLTMFAHFHAYLWPTAVQHLIAVGTVLALMNLFLRADQRMRLDRPAGSWYTGTLVTMAFASLQRSALLGPLLMMVHVLFASASTEERKQSFDQWLPGWILCGIYPSVALASVGDPRITALFFHWPGPVFAKALVLWGSGIAFLLLVRRGIFFWERHPERRASLRGFVLLGMIGGIVLWALRDKRQWVFLYNAVVPFTATTAAFLEPIRTALLIPSTEPYHIIPPQISIWSVGLAAALVAVFAAGTPARRRVLPVFGVWYAVGLLYFLQPYSSFPVHIPSRYFIYLSPIFAIVFASVVSRAGETAARRFQIPPFWREAAVVGFVAALCIPNLVAIRLELFRGRLANTYLLVEDLHSGEKDPFSRFLSEGQAAWKGGNLSEAIVFFRQAAETRPFLLRYVLGSYRLEDARWVTGGSDVRQWVSKTTGLYASWGQELPDWDPAFRRTASELHRELSDYLFCLLALACLEDRSGNQKGSEHWLSQMGFVEQDGWRFSRWISEDTRVKGNPQLSEFARRLADPVRLWDPLPWRKDDFGFGLFMMRLLTRW